jgi:hypothetical protein
MRREHGELPGEHLVSRRERRRGGRRFRVALQDLSFVALLLSLIGEVVSAFAGETVLVLTFFFTTMVLCVAVWRWEAD